MVKRMGLIYSQLDTLYGVCPHASPFWTEQYYAHPVQFSMELQNSIHILIGWHGQIHMRFFHFLPMLDMIFFFSSQYAVLNFPHLK
jgi:hypothetical protein